MSFKLNERLAKGGHDFGMLGICRILLKDNAIFPWFVIIPEVDETITEIHQLSDEDYVSVSTTIRQVSGFVDQYSQPDKVNVGAIGNIVRQLHIHIIARFENDLAWPGVVWGCKEKKPYLEVDVLKIQEAFKKSLHPK